MKNRSKEPNLAEKQSPSEGQSQQVKNRFQVKNRESKVMFLDLSKEKKQSEEQKPKLLVLDKAQAAVVFLYPNRKEKLFHNCLT